MITTAKGLTSAYAPMGGVIVSDRVSEPFMSDKQKFTHGITFGGHPVAAAMALANLDIFEREDLCGHVREKEPEFRGMLDKLMRTCRSSATCAARATSTRSSSSRTRTPRRASATRRARSCCAASCQASSTSTG